MGHHHQIPPPPPNGPSPVSRTYQYRKVMKPMLERKRRARINRCLDELKDLMVVALQAEGENVSKLEKADILELTVRHLHRLRRQESEEGDKYKEGFNRCASEVSEFLGGSREQHLVHHLGACLGRIEEGATLVNEPLWRPW